MDMLSQEEIDALLGGGTSETDDSLEQSDQGYSDNRELLNILSDSEKDALGEIGNISMGTSATTLFTLLNQKVTITAPKVRVISWRDLSNEYVKPCVGIKVEYSQGLLGSNVLVLRENDVKIIADLMMGGDGTNTSEDLSDLHLSAMAEAMNQMVGSSSTSLSTMLNAKIDIMPPKAFHVNFDHDDDEFFKQTGLDSDIVVCTSFRMEIGSLIDSEIMQIFSVDFAKSMVEGLLKTSQSESQKQPRPQAAPQPQPQYQPSPQTQYQASPQTQYQAAPQPNINAQPVQFQNFDYSAVAQQKENIGIIMDVPLEVTVELGRTHKLIKDILKFSPGTIIELDTLAGEPIDILVNGKFVAKGEVVVIDENFGIRVTDIISVENRI